MEFRSRRGFADIELAARICVQVRLSNVSVLSPGRPGTQPLRADQRIADADPMGFDGGG